MSERQQLRLGHLNHVALMGRATKEPDLRYTPSGVAVLNFHIAVDRSWKDKATDEWKKEVSFFSIQAWNKSAEYLSKKMRKGDAVLVIGELRSRSWEGKDGTKQYVVEVTARQTQVLTMHPEGSEPSQPAEGGGDELPKDDIDAIPF